MPTSKEPDSLDAKFYKPADAFFPAYSNIGLTFDDVTLATRYSEVLPRDTQLDTKLAEGLDSLGVAPARLGGFRPESGHWDRCGRQHTVRCPARSVLAQGRSSRGMASSGHTGERTAGRLVERDISRGRRNTCYAARAFPHLRIARRRRREDRWPEGFHHAPETVPTPAACTDIDISGCRWR